MRRLVVKMSLSSSSDNFSRTATNSTASEVTTEGGIEMRLLLLLLLLLHLAQSYISAEDRTEKPSSNKL